MQRLESFNYLRKTDKNVRLAVVGCLIAFFAGTLIYSLSLRYTGTSDAPLHLDYSWQLSKLNLPSFSEGTKIPLGKTSSIQYVSQHPPLFYLLIVPSSIFIEQDNYRAAMFTARLINIIISAATVFAVYWLGTLIFEKSRKLNSLLFASFTTSLVPFVKVAGDVMNDSLFILVSTVFIAIGVKIIKQGVTNKRIVFISAIAALGMSTRSTFIVILLVVLSLVAISILLDKKIKSNRYIKSVIPALASFICISLVIGWFYYRNYKLSGDWYRSGSQNWIAEAQGRNFRSASDLFASVKFWLLMPSGIFGNSWTGWLTVFGQSFNYIASIILFTVYLTIGNIKFYTINVKKKEVNNVLVYFLLILLFITPITLQIRHSIGYGAYNYRYLLSAVIPLSIFVIFAHEYFINSIDKKFKLKTTILAALFLLLTFINWIAVILNTVWYTSIRNDTSSLNLIEKYEKALSYNSFSIYIIIILLILLIGGIALQFIAIKNILNDKNK